MNIQLIQGNFSAADAAEIITQMIQVKIKYHENKISQNSNEEDIKTRETKIKKLQQDLFNIRDFIQQNNAGISVQSQILLSVNN